MKDGDFEGDISNPLCRLRDDHLLVKKSGPNTLTTVPGLTAGQSILGQGLKKSAATVGKGNLIPMRVKSYRQSSESSFESFPGSEIGSAYSQYLLSHAGAKGKLDIPEITKNWIKAVPISEREELPGYAGADFDKIQHCLTEVSF